MGERRSELPGPSTGLEYVPEPTSLLNMGSPVLQERLPRKVYGSAVDASEIVHVIAQTMKQTAVKAESKIRSSGCWILQSVQSRRTSSDYWQSHTRLLIGEQVRCLVLMMPPRNIRGLGSPL